MCLKPTIFYFAHAQLLWNLRLRFVSHVKFPFITKVSELGNLDSEALLSRNGIGKILTVGLDFSSPSSLLVN